MHTFYCWCTFRTLFYFFNCVITTSHHSPYDLATPVRLIYSIKPAYIQRPAKRFRHMVIEPDMRVSYLYREGGWVLRVLALVRSHTASAHLCVNWNGWRRNRTKDSKSDNQNPTENVFVILSFFFTMKFTCYMLIFDMLRDRVNIA